MTLPITQRLLCASQHAYMIAVAGPTLPSKVPPAPGPSTLVGYEPDPPQCYVGANPYNAGLIGVTSTEIIVAFRGTEPFNSPDTGQMVLDWLNDADAVFVPGPTPNSRVHKGFNDSLDDLWPLMGPALKALADANPNLPVCITGHSKGGAIASLAAMRCPALNISPYVCTFESARPGDQGFATAYDAAIPHSVRYEYQDDVVPHLPPHDAFVELLKRTPLAANMNPGLETGFVSVGDLKFINWDDQIVGDSSILDFERLLGLSKLIVTCQFEKIIADHIIAPGSGCADVVCSGVWLTS